MTSMGDEKDPAYPDNPIAQQRPPAALPLAESLRFPMPYIINREWGTLSSEPKSSVVDYRPDSQRAIVTGAAAAARTRSAPKGPCIVRSGSMLIGRVGQHGGDPGPAPLQHVITTQDGPLGIALEFAEAPVPPSSPPPPPTGSESLASLEEPVATDSPPFTAFLSCPH
ncbi:hypothetical protein CTAM01_06973 [Colletotrichum tamarilloi]|uniref:Uncharacterized protein n=2 Tax=Colletotrichum acutatum species complex TaxID=2707335 RepID=A0ABQ9RBC2_9PEZI|nr:uncharacterized protein CTAM01_06973 [Colletotrichum tamarilloi]KAK1499779.1 hypothetical protein CTAM01_06973 [Colletotrichum tamarilloi]